MYQYLENKADGYHFYYARRQQFDTEQNLSFRKSPRPFFLSPTEQQTLLKLGPVLARLMKVISGLYQSHPVVTEALGRNLPRHLAQSQATPSYLFYRPDLIYSETGFKLCEIETSIFGLGLAAILNEAYEEKGFNPLVKSNALKQYLQKQLPKTGAIIYTRKTGSYRDQLRYLADKIFSQQPGDWQAISIDDPNLDEKLNQVAGIYRAFYLAESVTDPAVKKLLAARSNQIVPSLTAQLEEKAILGLVWDERLDKILMAELGTKNLEFLREIIPLTSNLGAESFCLKPLPVTNLTELASLPKSARQYVLKVSGFGEGGSWAEGVSFLHRESRERVLGLLQQAQQQNRQHYILQEFTKPKKVPLEYYDNDTHALTTMAAHLRITPYFAATSGELLTIKITGCENTDFIHASSSSVNTAVALSIRTSAPGQVK